MTNRPGANASAGSILSIDVEDWFHILEIPGAPDFASWASLPSRVEANTNRLFDLLDQYGVKATCFFLGWIGEHYPRLVKEAVARGHEVASHGYAHRLVYRLSRQEFVEDALRTRRLLEDLAGCPVNGYRGAGFSVTESVDWFFDGLAEAGYVYDSSVFPAACGHGGIQAHRREPHAVVCNSGRILEFPITVADVFGKRVCFFGGGYLRLFPYPLVRRMARRVLAEGRPVIYYVHPREIDSAAPRLPMPLARRFKSYVNIRTTEAKLKRLMGEFSPITFRDYIQLHFQFEAAHAHH